MYMYFCINRDSVYIRTYEPFQDINLCTELLCCHFSCYCHWRMMHPHAQSMCAVNLAVQIVVLSLTPTTFLTKHSRFTHIYSLASVKDYMYCTYAQHALHTYVYRLLASRVITGRYFKRRSSNQLNWFKKIQ